MGVSLIRLQGNQHFTPPLYLITRRDVFDEVWIDRDVLVAFKAMHPELFEFDAHNITIVEGEENKVHYRQHLPRRDRHAIDFYSLTMNKDN